MARRGELPVTVSRPWTKLHSGDKFYYKGQLVQFERRNMQWFHVRLVNQDNKLATVRWPPEAKPHEIYVDLV